MTHEDSQDKSDPQVPQQVSCEQCRKQLPADEAVVEEAKDYVHWFCGQDCYQHWQLNHKRES